jgi:hypothetical protein
MDVNSHVFASSYASALHDHVFSASEDSLQAAYELGRAAVSNGMSLLELVSVHHEVLLSQIRRSADAGEAESVTQAARDFLLESLSAFEMVRRVDGDAREAAAIERRHVEMLRQLSTFLGDASLALNASESLEEILRLIAEQARELTGANLCVANLIEHGGSGRLQASSHSNAAAPGLDEVAGGWGPRRTAESGLAVPLTALDGEELGSIQLFDKEHGEFTAVDEEALVHLAQMASAAIERIRLYGALRGDGSR